MNYLPFIKEWYDDEDDYDEGDVDDSDNIDEGTVG